MACNRDLCGIHLLVCSDPQIPALQPPSERAALPPDVGSSLLGLSTFCFFICLDPVLIRPDLEFQSVGVRWATLSDPLTDSQAIVAKVASSAKGFGNCR